MKATGIVRRIDDLGRIVIPKEIRRTMHIREGDPLEIFTDIDCIQFKKYSPVKELKDFAEPYAEALAKSTDKSVLITDKQGVIAAAIKFNRNSADGISAQREEFKNLKFEILQKRLTPFAENILEEGISYVYDGTGEYVLEGVNKAASVIEPIKLFGDILGAVVLLENQTLHATDADKKTAKVAADYLAKLLED